MRFVKSNISLVRCLSWPEPLHAWELSSSLPLLSPAWQEACERSLAEMESSHQQVMEELQRHHQRELERLRQEKERLLAEEAAATAAGRSGHQAMPEGPSHFSQMSLVGNQSSGATLLTLLV